MPAQFAEYFKFPQLLELARAQEEQRAKEYTYRIYVADALKIIGENLAKAWGGSSLNVRLYDLLEGETEPEDTRTGEEIVADICARLDAMSEGKEDSEPI